MLPAPSHSLSPAASRSGSIHRSAALSQLGMLPVSERDWRILALAARKARVTKDFNEALRALREAVEELIPAGRIYFLGSGKHGPIVGSIASGVGITADLGEILVVRVHPEAGYTTLGRFSP